MQAALNGRTCRLRRRPPPGHLGAHERDHLAAELDGVRDEVVAARGQDAHPEVVVVHEGGGDGLRGADQRRRVARAAGGRRGDRPQRPIVSLALRRDGQQPLRARVLGVLQRVAAGERLATLRAVLDRGDRGVGLLPRLLLGVAEDRTEGHLERRRRSTGVLGELGDRRDLLGRARQRLAPQGVDVGLFGADLVRRGRRTAEGDLRARLLRGLDVEHEVVEGVVLAVEVEGRPLGPRPLEDLDRLAGAVVAAVLGQRVAFALLLVVVAAGDDVQREAPAGDLVERGHGLRRERRVGDVRAVGQQQLQPLGAAGDQGGGLRGIGASRAVRGEHPVPAGLLVGAGQCDGVLGIEGGAGARVRLRAVVGRAYTEELDGHDDPNHADHHDHSVAGGLSHSPGPTCGPVAGA
jgi:hypothetical protein